MTVNTSWYVMGNKLGVNLNKVVASVTITANPAQPEYPGVPHNLGDMVQGNDGSEWMFVQASTTVTTYNVVGIDKNLKANNMTISFATNTLAAHSYGVAQMKPYGGVSVGAANGGVINPGEFFWALMKANAGARINLAAALSVDGPSALYIGTAGVLASSGSCRMNGVEAVGSVGGSAAAEVVFFSYMMPAFIVSASAVSA